MLKISTEIKEVSKDLNISVDELSVEETKNIFDEISKKYTNNYDSSKLLWEALKERKSVNDKDAWMWIKDFVDSEAIMFFNPEQEKNSFLFANGEDMVSVLGESYAFEFYITNKEFEYFICFNHHDYLICSGSAQNWIEKFIK